MSASVARTWRRVCLTSSALVLVATVAAAIWGVAGLEIEARDALLAQASPRVRDTAHWVSQGGTWRVLVPATAALLLFSGHARGRAWLWVGTAALAPSLGDVWQEVVARPRPHGAALGFPSGHATAVAAVAVSVIYLAGRSRLSRRRLLAVQGLTAGTIALVALSRVVLSAHWPGDVLAGVSLGTACAAGAAWWDAAHPGRPRPAHARPPERRRPGEVVV